MVGIDKWGLPKSVVVVASILAAGVVGGWGGRVALSAEFNALETRWQARIEQERRVWEAVVAAERATSAASYATREQLSDLKLANERFYNRMLREMRR